MSNCLVCNSLIEMSQFGHNYIEYINYLYTEIFKKTYIITNFIIMGKR